MSFKDNDSLLAKKSIMKKNVVSEMIFNSKKHLFIT
jgi:hypothetical protein